MNRDEIPTRDIANSTDNTTDAPVYVGRAINREFKNSSLSLSGDNEFINACFPLRVIPEGINPQRYVLVKRCNLHLTQLLDGVYRPTLEEYTPLYMTRNRNKIQVAHGRVKRAV